MKIHRPAVVVLSLLGAIAGCHVYIDEPARQQAAAPSPPPPPPKPPATAAARAATPAATTKEVHLHLHEPPPAGGTTPPSTACFDTGAATPGDCGAMQSSNACTSNSASLQKCNAYKAYFQPKVAAAAVTCMTKLSGAAVCDATQASSCAKAALAQACPDPEVNQLCQIAATSCKTATSDCVASISGLNDQGKQLVAQCVAQGCSTGLFACIDGLASASTAASSKH